MRSNLQKSDDKKSLESRSAAETSEIIQLQKKIKRKEKEFAREKKKKSQFLAVSIFGAILLGVGSPLVIATIFAAVFGPAFLSLFALVIVSAAVAVPVISHINTKLKEEKANTKQELDNLNKELEELDQSQGKGKEKDEVEIDKTTVREKQKEQEINQKKSKEKKQQKEPKNSDKNAKLLSQILKKKTELKKSPRRMTLVKEQFTKDEPSKSKAEQIEKKRDTQANSRLR